MTELTVVAETPRTPIEGSNPTEGSTPKKTSDSQPKMLILIYLSILSGVAAWAVWASVCFLRNFSKPISGEPSSGSRALTGSTFALELTCIIITMIGMLGSGVKYLIDRSDRLHDKAAEREEATKLQKENEQIRRELADAKDERAEILRLLEQVLKNQQISSSKQPDTALNEGVRPPIGRHGNFDEIDEGDAKSDE